jgi:hypothetical protein
MDTKLKLHSNADILKQNIPAGKGRTRTNFKNVSRYVFSQLKRSLVVIPASDDPMSLAKAILVGQVFVKYPLRGEGNTQKQNIRNKLRYPKVMKKMALQLCQTAGVELTQGESYAELVKFQKHFKDDYIITVFIDRRCRVPFFNGREYSDKATRRINLYLDLEQKHYDIIVNMFGFCSRASYCWKCFKGYNIKNHTCKDIFLWRDSDCSCFKFITAGKRKGKVIKMPQTNFP